MQGKFKTDIPVNRFIPAGVSLTFPAGGQWGFLAGYF